MKYDGPEWDADNWVKVTGDDPVAGEGVVNRAGGVPAFVSVAAGLVNPLGVRGEVGGRVEQAQEEQNRTDDEQNFLVSCRQKEGPPPYLGKDALILASGERKTQ